MRPAPSAPAPFAVARRLPRPAARSAPFAPVRPAPALLALALAAPGCSSDDGRRAEAGRVLYAVDRLVAADRGAKGPPLRALEVEPCTDPAVCRAKEACVGAFRPLEESARLQQEIRAEMAAAVASGAGAGGGRLPPDRALELFEKTDRAERAKQASERQVDGCLQEAARLRTALRR